MRDYKRVLKDWVYSAKSNTPKWFVIISIVCISLLLITSAVSAQIEGTWDNDFEDGNADEWSGGNIDVVSTNSGIGEDFSLKTTDGLSDQTQNPEWDGGPRLNLTQDFTVRGTSRIDQGDSSGRAGFGIVREAADGENATGVILLFSGEYGSTFIATNNLEDPNANNLEQIGTDYDGTWVKWEFTSEGDGNVKAKVWPVGSTEPQSYDIERQLDPDEGRFSIFVGTSPSGREVLLDRVTINGTAELEESDPRLNIDTRNYMRPGTTQEYRVTYDLNTTGVGNETIDVTDNSTVRSENPDVLTVDNTTNQLQSTNNTSASQRVLVRADYNGSTTYTNVTVATANMSNLSVLPPLWRVNATFGDSTIQAILIALFAGIFGARVSTSFGGLALMQLTMVAAWFTGYATIGITMISLFAALFIGLNMAANIDYTVRQ